MLGLAGVRGLGIIFWTGSTAGQDVPCEKKIQKPDTSHTRREMGIWTGMDWDKKNEDVKELLRRSSLRSQVSDIRQLPALICCLLWVLILGQWWMFFEASSSTTIHLLCLFPPIHTGPDSTTLMTILHSFL